KGSTTSLPKIKQLKALGVDPFLIQLEHDNAETDQTFFRSEILIICIPPGRNKENLKSYTEKIGQLGNLAAATGIQQVLMVSSTAVYKDSKQVLTEA
ncbi:hypothetical protein N4308_14240, partial [Staphylococcus aureus]|nr:hypothetical protein [Staphylococcus aureus]